MTQTNQVRSQNIQKPLDKKELEFLYVLAERLGAPLSLLETYNSLALNSYINEELERRLGTNDAFHVKAKLFKNSPFLILKFSQSRNRLSVKVAVNLPANLLKQSKRNRKISLRRRKNLKVVESI